MVKKIFKFLNKEFNGVNEAALLLGGFAFLSQILGLVRDRMLAHSVGAGPTLDIYYAAFRIPDFLYISVASVASITVLMPFLVERINSPEGTLKAKMFLNSIFSVFMVFMVGSSVLIALVMPYIVHYIAPGFTESQTASLVLTSRIMLFSPIFIGLSNLIGTITQLYRNFFIFSLSPLFYNIGILCGIIFFYPHFGVYGLAGGVIIGSLLHLLVQIPIVVQRGFFPRFTSRIRWNEIIQVMKLSAPRTLTLSCGSIAFMVLIAIASTLKPGSISLFTFSYNLQSVPVGIIGISYSVAAFPVLVKSFSLKDMKNFTGQIIQTSQQIIFWSFPIMTLLVVLRAQIVRVILGSNTFSWADTRLTAAAIALFVISLATQSLVLLFVRGYYAAGNSKKPLIVNVFSSLMVLVFAFVFIFIFKSFPTVLKYLEGLLRVRDVEGTIMLALPLAYACGSIVNFFLLWILFKKDFLKGTSSNLATTFIQSITASLVMGIVAYECLNILDDIFIISRGQGIFFQGFFSGIIGILVGILTLRLMKNEQLEDIRKALSHKFWNKRIIAPEQSVL